MKTLVSCLTVLLLCSTAMAVNINKVDLDVPEVGVITLDGDLSDWSASSNTLTWGDWFPGGAANAYAFASQYAWSDSNNVIYVGVTTDAPSTPLTIEVALGRNGADASNGASGGGSVSQTAFDDLDSTVTVISQGGLIAGISAASATVGGITTLEAAIPVYDDHTDVGSLVDLAVGQLIYNYADCLDVPTYNFGDHQNFDGEQPFTYATPIGDFGTRLNLVPEPATLVLIMLGGLMIRRKKSRMNS